MGSDQHPGCTVSTYFEMQKGTFLPQTFKPFPDGPRGVREWVKLNKVGSACPTEHHDGGLGLWWGTDKRHP